MNKVMRKKSTEKRVNRLEKLGAVKSNTIDKFNGRLELHSPKTIDGGYRKVGGFLHRALVLRKRYKAHFV